MTAVFLDLDGTLMDSRPGILRSLGHALRATGHERLAEDDLTWLIGPPFVESFAQMGIADPDPVIEAYRLHYKAEGMFEARVYPGVVEALETLRAAGRRLYLATAKPHDYARRITAHFGLAPLLEAEFGPELDGTRNWKGDLLAHALRETGESPTAAVMVGDRHHDMAAAAEVGMPAVAARWGYGEPPEWDGAAAEVARAADLPQAIVGLGL